MDSKMRFDSKGQAFDVFKLLIAAVIAIAMLAILVPILESIGLINLSNPSSEAVNLIKSNVDKPSQYSSTSKAVNFTKNDSLNAKAISEKAAVGLDTAQICLSLGDFSTDGPFDEPIGSSTSGNMLVKLKQGISQQKVNIGVLCDDGASIDSSLQLNNLEQINVSQCEIQQTSQTYCIIMLRYA